MINEAAYWIALAHLPNWGNLKRNSLIVKFYHESRMTPEEFFNLTENDWKDNFGLSGNELSDLREAKSQLASNAFLAEQLFNEGYELIPITSPDYSKTLKENFKTSSPTLLYIKGNKQIMSERSVAIVGSRDATDISLNFADNIAKLASKEYKVVVSGFAKGVDKQALDSAIKYKGQSIIVLPQGVMTFGTGFKTYYRQITDGDILVLSIFLPKAPWKTELAMARNPVIYGLASEIYVAESSDKGGTWSGAMDGLKKGRKIFVRKPGPGEKNANGLLIQKGAVAVDFDGILINDYSITTKKSETISLTEPDADYGTAIINLLRSGEYSIPEILKRIHIILSENELKEFLKTHKEIEVIKRRSTKYTIRSLTSKQKSLFD